MAGILKLYLLIATREKWQNSCPSKLCNDRVIIKTIHVIVLIFSQRTLFILNFQLDFCQVLLPGMVCKLCRRIWVNEIHTWMA